MNNNGKSLENWIWDAACSIRGATDAAKYKEFILPLIFTKRLCDVFDDELNRIAKEVGSRTKAFKVVKNDKKLVRFYLPLEPKNPDDAVWSVVRTLSNNIGEGLRRRTSWIVFPRVQASLVAEPTGAGCSTSSPASSPTAAPPWCSTPAPLQVALAMSTAIRRRTFGSGSSSET